MGPAHVARKVIGCRLTQETLFLERLSMTWLAICAGPWHGELGRCAGVHVVLAVQAPPDPNAEPEPPEKPKTPKNTKKN